MISLSGLFTREAIVAHLKALPVIKTPVMDSVFTDRPQLPLPLVGVDEITAVTNELPVVKRGAPSISATSESGAINFYEPMPIRPHKMVTGADLNNLKLLTGEGLQTWAQTRTDYLRRSVRKTTEAMCALTLGGSLSWPLQRETGGFDPYLIDYGSILSVTVGTAWNNSSAKIKDVFATLVAMHEKLQENGYGSEIEIWAGTDAYNALFALCEGLTSTAKFGIAVKVSDQGIDIGGYLVKRRAEKYRNPETGAVTATLDAETVRMVAKDAGHKLIYCAVDDLDANLQALPLFVKPVKIADPSGYKLVGESKPFPVVNIKGVCDCDVIE